MATPHNERRPRWLRRRHRQEVGTQHGRILELLGATLLGGVLSLGGSYLAAQATLGSVERQTTEARAEEDRARKAEVYSEYLAAANKLADSATNFIRQGNEALERGEEISATTEPMKSFIANVLNYKNSASRLYVFGSDEAWAAHQALAETLPPEANPSIQKEDTKRFTYPRYSQAYEKFLAIYCIDVSPSPRTGCREDVRR